MHNQPTIAGSDRFTRTVSRLPFLLRVLFAKDHRGVDLISDALPFGRLWYTKPDDAIGYAMHRSRAHPAVIRVYALRG